MHVRSVGIDDLGCIVFFFQTVDGIRAFSVTGVLTCAQCAYDSLSWTAPTSPSQFHNHSVILTTLSLRTRRFKAAFLGLLMRPPTESIPRVESPYLMPSVAKNTVRPRGPDRRDPPSTPLPPTTSDRRTWEKFPGGPK